MEKDRARARGRTGERRNSEVSVYSRATCTLNDKRRPLSTVQCEKWPHVTDETIRRAPTTSRYDNIAKSFRECARIALAHTFVDGRVLFAQVASRACEITISESKSAFEH